MNRKLNPAKCQTVVHPEYRSFFGHQCQLRPIVTRDGKLYCRIHDPEYISSKKAERLAKWNKEHTERLIKHDLDNARRVATEGLTLEELKQVTPGLIRQRILFNCGNTT